VEDDEIRALLTRLARPHPSGGAVIERAALAAEGSSLEEIIDWITAHDGLPEEVAAARPAAHGLHGSRVEGARVRPAARYVLPRGVLAQQT